MNKETIKKVKAVVLISVVLGVFSFGFNAGQSYPHSPVDPPSATETNITTDSITIPGWLDVKQINASWIKTPMASESTYIVAASDSLNKEHANWVCDGTADQAEINQAIAALPETVVVWDNCDGSAGSWTGVQGDETISNDNVDFAEGAGSLNCVGGTANDSGIKRTGLASLDWSGYNLIRLYFKQDVEYDCWLFFYDGAGNWERYDFSGRTVWHQHSISIGSHPDAISAVALDWTDIVEVRIQVDADDDGYTFRVDCIRLVDRIGGKVVLLEGDYTIDDKIIGDADTVLAGCGDNSCIFVADGTDVGNTKDGDHIIFEDCDNVAVKDLQINLNGANLGGIADKHGIGFRHVYRGVMLNIKAYNLRLGGNVLSIIHSDAVEVSQCYVENFDDYGIAIARCDDCSAHDNVVVGTSGDEMWGIAITGGFPGGYYSYDCSITNNRVKGAITAIHLRKSHRCSVIGNNCYNFQTKGVAVSSSYYALVSNNILDGNHIGWVGIQTYKRTEGVTNYTCGNIDIIGNIIRACEKVDTNVARGILVNDARYSSVVGNNIRDIDSDDGGVGIDVITTYVVISGNTIIVVHDGIIAEGYSCITGNQLYSLTGDGITCSGATGRLSIVGNYLWAVGGTEILSTGGDNHCCVGNWLKDGTINLAGASNTVENNET